MSKLAQNKLAYDALKLLEKKHRSAKRWKRTAGLLALALVAILAIAATKIVETGEGRAEDFVLGTGNHVDATDSTAGWVGINSIVIEETSGSAPVTVNCYFRSKYSTITVSAGKSLTLPVEFLPIDRIKTHAQHPDTVVHCTAGTCRVYLVGG